MKKKLLYRKLLNLNFSPPFCFPSFSFFFSFFVLLTMKIIPIHVLEDNYSYILIDEKTKEAAVIDPVEPIKILNVISQTGAKLSRFTFKFYNSISILTNL